MHKGRQTWHEGIYKRLDFCDSIRFKTYYRTRDHTKYITIANHISRPLETHHIF